MWQKINVYHVIVWLISSILLYSQLAHAIAEIQPGFTKYYKSSYSRYLEHAEHSPPPQSYNLYLQAVGRLLQDRRLSQAEQLLQSLPLQKMTPLLQYEYQILLANLNFLKQQPYRSLHVLHQIPDPEKLLMPQKIAYYQLVALNQLAVKNYLGCAEARITLDPLLNNTHEQHQNRQQIWQTLSQLTTSELASQLRHNPAAEMDGWFEIAYLHQMFKNQPDLLASERQHWQQHHPQHPANSVLPSSPNNTRNFFRDRAATTVNITANRGHKPLQIALLLPTSGPHASEANAIKAGFMSAYYETQQNSPTRTDINLYNTVGRDVQSIYRQAVHEGANVVVGPLTKAEVARIEALGALPVPTLGLNFTAHEAKGVTNLLEYALSPQDEVQQVAKKIAQDNQSNVLMIVPDDSWGKNLARVFTQALLAHGGKIVDSAYYKQNTGLDLMIKHLLNIDEQSFNQLRQGYSEIEQTTLPRRTDFDSIFMIANPSVARQIKPLLQFYFADTIPVYATSEVYTGTPEPILDRDLNGIVFCDIPLHIQTTLAVNHARQHLQQLNPQLAENQTRLYAFGYDAYQLALYLNPFRLTSHHNISGLTGELYLDNQQVLRQLPWAKFINGLPHSINR